MSDSVKKSRAIKRVWAKDGRLIKEILEGAPDDCDLPKSDSSPFFLQEELDEWPRASRKAGPGPALFDLMI